ncbi:hypothetical protein NUH87_31120 [Pseudomonas batumici]|uniref:hypothetical protein n=1 Tax=Pseudomonas batumici TaxID=226910 RepID=UPI0030CFC737
MGTTLALAHTGKAVFDTSIAFEKMDDIEALSEMRVDSVETFIGMLQKQITHLQVLVLSDDLNSLLTSKFDQGARLTAGEEKHLNDYREPNYVETSLLPALAVYQMETLNKVEHLEFSKDTAKFIESKLSEIDHHFLENLIKGNQSDIFYNKLTVEVKGIELAKLLKERAKKQTLEYSPQSVP